MRRLLAIAAAAGVLALASGTASAQSVGVEVYSGPRYDSYRYYDRDVVRPGPRVYGYYGDDAVFTEPRVIVRPANCGQYRYWTGTHCADARLNPPDLN